MEESNKKNVIIETYAEDMAQVVGDNQDGIVKKIIEEQEKHDAENKKTSPETNKNKIFLFLGILFVFLSLAAVVLVLLFKKEILTVEVKPQYVPIIFTDKTEFREISSLKKEEILQTIVNEVNTAEVKYGGVEGVFLTVDKKVIGLKKFLELIEAKIDQTKMSFIEDNFLIGATNMANKEDLNPKRDLFILIKMRSIADVFEPMHLWEGKMFSDLSSLFGVKINADTKYLLTKDFEDGFIQNKNARILRDKDGKIVLMYVFAEEDSLIITNSEVAVREVMLRLASSRVKK